MKRLQSQRRAGGGSLAKALRFATVGASGLVVNSLALGFATGWIGLHYVVGSILATQTSTLWNFVLSEWMVFSSAAYRHGRGGRFVRFAAANNAFLLVRGPLLVLLVDRGGMHYLAANLLTLAASFAARYLVADRFIWRSPTAGAPALAPALVAPSVPPTARWRAPLVVRSATASAGTVEVGPAVAAGHAPSRPWATASGAPAWTWGIVAGLAGVVMAGLRLWDLGAVGYNSDEAVYAGQGRTLVGDVIFADHFSLFRAHPLVLQFVVGAATRVLGDHDASGRTVVALLFGVGSVAVSYLLAARLYGRHLAIISTLLLAALPYHVIVSRQVMVDTPMGFFVVLCVWLLARYVTAGGGSNLVAAFVALGLAVLSKEVAIIGLLPFAATLYFHQRWSLLRERACWIGGLLFVAIILPFPATRLVNQPGNAGQFFLWQLFRDPNHPPEYFLRVLLQFAGPIFLTLFLLGLWAQLRRRHTVDLVLLPWLFTFGIFFNVWPTKLFPYLFPILPMMCIAAAIGLVRVVALASQFSPWLAARSALALVLATVVVGASLAIDSASTVAAGPTAQIPGRLDFDIEVQTFAGGREMAGWIEKNTPPNARLLTIGPSIGNVVRFYGDRDSVALSVSPDPLKRNPAYIPVTNPDAAIRNMDVQYALWDAYSADRSVFYNARLMRYVRKYQGVPVFAIYIDGAGKLQTVHGMPPEGADRRMVLYNLRGGSPHDWATTGSVDGGV